MNSNNGNIRIGTSGILVPGTKIDFPEEFKSGTRLHYYGFLFNTIEINSSFYKIPLPSTFTKWKFEVPEDFKFTVKLWRGISHVDKLNFKEDDVNIFMRSINNIEDKSGCLLLQFPPAITFVFENKIEELLQYIKSRDESNRWSLAVEFRHASWYQEATYAMLERYNASLVFHDMPKSETPWDYVGYNVIYCRLHGPSGGYKGSYADEIIRNYADRIKKFSDKGKNIYVYFNNTIEGALENAQLLQKLI